MSSEIIFDMRITISSTSQNSYFAGKTFTVSTSDFTRLRGNASLLLLADREPTLDCRLFVLGDSGAEVLLVAGGGTAPAMTVGVGGRTGNSVSPPAASIGAGSLLIFILGLHCVPASTYWYGFGRGIVCFGVDLEARREIGEDGVECDTFPGA
jgi:hypothetical protein